jgi:hypothetical protein
MGQPHQPGSGVFEFKWIVIHHHYDLGGTKYVLPWIRLAEEASLTLEELRSSASREVARSFL